MSFDRLAPFYARMESLLVGRTLQRCRVAFLAEAAEAREILLAGEGHGRFLHELVRVNPVARISCLDASAEMLAVSKSHVPRDGATDKRVRFIHSSICRFAPDQSFDFIAAQFFLDCFEVRELENVVQKLSSLLAPQGRLSISDFQVPPGGWRAARARTALFLAYRFFRLATRLSARRLVPPQEFLLQNGLRRVKRAEFNYQLLYADFGSAEPGMDYRLLLAPS